MFIDYGHGPWWKQPSQIPDCYKELDRDTEMHRERRSDMIFLGNTLIVRFEQAWRSGGSIGVMISSVGRGFRISDHRCSWLRNKTTFRSLFAVVVILLASPLGDRGRLC